MAGRLLGELFVGGTAYPSGSVRFFQVGTTSPVNVYRDDALTQVITQPVSLDSTGRTVFPVYLAAPVRAVFYDAFGAQKLDVERLDGDRAELVSLANTKWPAESTVDAAFTALGASLGGMDGNYLAGANGAVGRTIAAKLTETSFSIVDFGGKGDGLTDCTGAFNAAIAAIKSAGGGTLYVPRGTYVITAAIPITGVNGLTIIGDGFAVTNIKQTTAATGVFSFNTCNGVRVFGINFLSNAANTGTAIALATCNYVEIYGVGVDALATANSFDVGIATSGTTTTVAIVECRFLCNNAAAARAFTSSGSLSRAWLLNSLITVNGSGIPIEFTQTNSQIVVAACIIQGGTTGISWTASVAGTGGYTIFGCFLSTIYSQPFTVGVATDPNIRQWGNQVDGYTVDVASGGTVTPDRTRGPEIRIRGTSTGVAYTINAPTPAPSSSMRDLYLILHFFNNAGGAVTGWTLNAAYHTTGAISNVDGNHSMLKLKWDADSSVWREETTRAVTT